MSQDRTSSPSEMRAAWEAVLDSLRSRIDSARFDRFVLPLRLVALDDETARLEAPDHLRHATASGGLLGHIRDAIDQAIGPRDVVVDLRRGSPQGELFPVARGRRRTRRSDSELQGRFTFDTFVVGASNQFAHAACLAVARQPGELYNPLFLYGGVGLGKTHLASAIGNAIKAEDPDAAVTYISSERFMAELIAALRSDRVAGFKRRYRSARILIVDDVQHLAGRDRTQEEFFHTFNALHDAGRQIVVTSEKIPNDIPGLEARLRNRLQWGLVADIQPPDLETRVAILGRKAEALGLDLPEETAMVLAERIASNVRSLEGALTRVATRSSLDGVPASADYVRRLIDDGSLGRHGPVTFDEIAQAVSERYGLSVQQLLSRRRTKQVALPRQVAMYLCRRLLDASYPRIGDLFGRDHTTALHGVRVISTRIARDADLQTTIESLAHRLGQGLSRPSQPVCQGFGPECGHLHRDHLAPVGRWAETNTVHRAYDDYGLLQEGIPEVDNACGTLGSGRETRMEVRVRREDLMRGLHLVQGVVERRSPQPILSHVLIEPDEKGVTLSATDMETGFRGHVDAIVKKPTPVTCSARKLYEITREVGAEEVTLRSASDGWIEVLAGRSKFKVVSLPPGDFPELPLREAPAKGSTMRVAAGTLREMIDRTLFSVSTDETRYNLSGVYMEADKGVLRMVATDGHRLAKIDRSLADVKMAKGVIMPQKGLREFRKILDEADVADVGLSIGERELRADLEGVAFFMRLVEGEFPNYGQVIPKETTRKAVVQRDDFLAALRRTSLLASERSHGVRIALSKGTLSLAASNPEQGEASEDIEASYGGDDVQVGFNARYLIEVLGVHPQGDTIEIGLTDEVGPGVIHGSQDPDYTYVLMPMRL